MLLNATYVMAALVVILAIYLAVSTKILRTSGTNPNAKYSFSNVQMMWWTVIIGTTFIILYGKTGDYNSLNQSTVILLSISLATIAGSSLINVGQKQKGIARHNNNDSQGFFQDILSDENGICMHRFQSMVFNILFGVTFITNFWMKQQFPEFNSSELTLIGVSSGAFLALKMNENKGINSASAVKEKTS